MNAKQAIHDEDREMPITVHRGDDGGLLVFDGDVRLSLSAREGQRLATFITRRCDSDKPRYRSETPAKARMVRWVKPCKRGGNLPT